MGALTLSKKPEQGFWILLTAYIHTLDFGAAGLISWASTNDNHQVWEVLKAWRLACEEKKGWGEGLHVVDKLCIICSYAYVTNI